MKCKYCNNEMRLDDKDVWRTYTDFYYQCDKCNAGCVIGKSKSKIVLSEEWEEPWDEGGL